MERGGGGVCVGGGGGGVWGGGGGGGERFLSSGQTCANTRRGLLAVPEPSCDGTQFLAPSFAHLFLPFSHRLSISFLPPPPPPPFFPYFGCYFSITGERSKKILK